MTASTPSGQRPPDWATRLLLRAVRAADRQAVRDEMEELFRSKAARVGPGAARRWYWRQAIAFYLRLGADRLSGVARGERMRRRVGFGSALAGDARVAWRSIRSAPGVSVVVVLTLALGIGANTAVFSLMYSVLLAPLPFPDPERVVVVRETYQRWSGLHPSPANYLAWRDETDAFQTLAALDDTWFTVQRGDHPERLAGGRVTANFLEVFGIAPRLGRGFVPADDEAGASPVVVLADGYWRRGFGADPGIVGTDVTIDGVPHAVVGVMPPTFRVRYPREQDFWIPGLMRQPAAADTATSYRWHWIRVAGRLADGRTIETVREELAALAERRAAAFPPSNEDWGVVVDTLHDAAIGTARTSLYLFAGAVGLVLLVACANVSNVLLGRILHRRRELAVRMALGASRGRAMRPVLVETVMLATLGGAVGLGLADVVTGGLLRSAPLDFSVADAAHVRGIAILFAAVVSLIAAGVSCIGPMIRFTDRHLEGVFRAAGGRGGAPASRLGSVLVAVESALVLVLLFGAGLMVSSLLRLTGTDPGFEVDAKATFELNLPAARYPMHREVERAFGDVARRIAGLPGVSAVGVTTAVPFGGSSLSFPTHRRDGRPSAVGVPSQYEGVTPGYFDAVGMDMRLGRDFASTDGAGSPPVVIVNETLAAAYFSDVSPLGQSISAQDSILGPWMTVIGVVADVRHVGLHRDPAPTMYVPIGQLPFVANRGDVVVRGDLPNPMPPIAEARDVLRAFDPELAVANPRSLEDVVAGSVADTRFQTRLLVVFAATALVLGAVGVYGVVSFSVGRRRREMALRMALGAARSDVTRLLLRVGVGPVAIGLAVGIASALGLARFMDSLVYGVETHDPVTLAGVSLLLVAVAVAATLVPAQRAHRIEPVRALGD